MNALIVDDEPCLLETFAIFVQALRQDAEVTKVASGEEAITLLRSGKVFDLVITDLEMGTPNGLAVVAIARVRLPGAKIALMSGNLDETSATMALKAGADKSFWKPPDLTAWRDFLKSA